MPLLKKEKMKTVQVNMEGAGDAAYVKGVGPHQFRNDGEEDFSFVRIVPEEGDK